MKVVVINFSGSIGKSTITKHLLVPRLPNHRVISVETINSSAVQGTQIKGGDFGYLQDALLVEDNLIVDVGTSNVEETIRMMQIYQGSHEDVGYFIVPVSSDVKHQVDTAETIMKLISIGVKPSKIRVVLNRIELGDNLELRFAPILPTLQTAKIKMPKIGVLESKVYDDLLTRKQGIDEVLESAKNLQSTLNQIENLEERNRAARMIGTYRLCKSAKQNLDEVFADMQLK